MILDVTAAGEAIYSSSLQSSGADDAFLVRIGFASFIISAAGSLLAYWRTRAAGALKWIYGGNVAFLAFVMWLDRCSVAPRMAAVLKAVAEAPPNAFAGGGYWEAMHGTMAGFYEVRLDGRDRRHFRLFCILERDGARLGLGGPSIVVLTGMEKPFRTTFTERDYARVRQLGVEYRSRVPRSVLR